MNKLIILMLFLAGAVFAADQHYKLDLPENRGPAVYRVEYQLRASAMDAAGMPEVAPIKVKLKNTDPRKDTEIPWRMFETRYAVPENTWTSQYFEVLARSGDRWVEFELAPINAKNFTIKDMQVREVSASPDFYRGAAPYPSWIESLRSNPAILNAPSLVTSAESVSENIWDPFNFKLSPGMIAELQSAVAPYLQLSPEELIKLVPERRPFETWYKLKSDARKPDGSKGSALYQWSPLKPEELRDANGNLVDIGKMYPKSGTDRITGPDGQTRDYDYYQISPEKAATLPCPPVFGDSRLPTVFRLYSGDESWNSREFFSAKKPGRPLTGGNIRSLWQIERKFDTPTQYAYIYTSTLNNIAAPTDDLITMGIQSNAPVEIWLNHEKIFELENCERELTSNLFQGKLNRLNNVLLLKVKNPPETLKLSLAGPHAVRREFEKRGLTPPAGKIYLDEFLTTVKHNHLRRAAYRMSVLYQQTKDERYALRAAALWYAVTRQMPTFPVYGKPNWDSNYESERFWPDDHYFWFTSNFDSRGSEWYPLAAGSLVFPLKGFDMIKASPAWAEIDRIAEGNARVQIADNLLECCRRVLYYDAWHRNSDFVLFHNIGSGRLRTILTAGIVLGSQELSGYGDTVFQGYMRRIFTRDYLFPESVSYFRDLLFGLRPVAELLKIAVPTSNLQFFDQMNRTIRQLGFPDGSQLTIHDTRSQTTSPEPWPARSLIGPDARNAGSPVLYPDFGHGILGSGKGENQLEAHLHYSRYCNHAHDDMLNFTLWAYGDELVPDIGYNREQLKMTSLAHNLVVVDQATQKTHERGNLLVWSSMQKSSVIQAEQGKDAAYPQAQTYRRLLASVSFGPGQNFVADFFEVEGGKIHEWMANGCADYPQTVESSLKYDNFLRTLDPNGKIWQYPPNAADVPGKRSNYYAAFLDFHTAKNPQPWNLTMRAEQPSFDYPGAGPRAKSQAPKPGLRLHWPDRETGQVMVGTSPRSRFENQMANRHLESRKYWAEQRMPKIIIRREGKKLNSIFTAVWEPFHQTPFLKSVTSIATENPSVRIIAVETLDGNSAELYFNPSGALFKHNGIEFSGKLLIAYKNPAGERSYELHDGDHLNTVKEPPLPEFRVIACDDRTFTVKPSQKLSDAELKRLSGYFRLSDQGQENRYYLLKELTPNPDGTLTVTTDTETGLQLDFKQNILRETFFPNRMQKMSKPVIIFPPKIAL